MTFTPDQQRILASWWVFFLAAFLSFVLVPLVRRVAFALDVVDRPGGRKIHATTKPLLGGAAVYLAFFGTVAFNWHLVRVVGASDLLTHTFAHALELAKGAGLVRSQVLAIFTGASIVFAVGLLDDLYGVDFPPAAKLGGQILAALVLLSSGVRTTLLPYALPYDLHNVVISLLWMVGITNAFNLLDNMDGLCSGVALIAAGILTFVAIRSGEFFLSLILSALSGSLLGFFRYNAPPSTIFLGDAGALLVGYLLGALVLVQSFVSYGESTILGVLMPVIIMSLPLFDTASVVWIRLREKRPIYRGDQSHLSHRLVALGLTESQAVQVIYLLAFCLGINATLLSDGSTLEGIIIAVQSAWIVILVAILMHLGAARRRAALEERSRRSEEVTTGAESR